MDEVVGGAVAPDPFSVCKAKLVPQGILDELHNGQPERRSEPGGGSHRRPTFVTERVVAGGMGVLCLRQPAVKSFQY